MKIRLFAAVLVLVSLVPANATRYLFYNIYGDASALSGALPSDVIAVPFGWTSAAESNRNSILSANGIGVSALPSLAYKNGSKWVELRIFDQTTKPWSWLKTNAAISSIFTVSMIGDSLIAQMVGVQSSQAPPFNTAQNLGVSGTTTSAIAATLSSVSSSATDIIIEGGVNDFLAGTDSQIITNYTTMLNAVPAGKLVVAVGILQVDWTLLNSLRPDLAALVDNTKIAAMNAQITALCLTHTNCTPATNVMSLSMVGETSDGMHFTAATYPDFVAAMIPSL